LTIGTLESENYHRVPRIGENLVPRIREIGSLQVHTWYLTLSEKKTDSIMTKCKNNVRENFVIRYAFSYLMNRTCLKDQACSMS